MSVAPTSDTEVVTGIVAGIIAKPPGQDGQPRWQVEVQPPGSGYTRKLWSKDAELVGQVNMLIGTELSFMCGKSHWTNRDGQPVTSLWVNGYGVPGSQVPAVQAVAVPVPVQPPAYTQPAVQPIPQAPPQAPLPPVPVAPVAPQAPAPQAPPQYGSTEQKIHRQTASKVAVQLLSFLEPQQQTFASLVAISERLVSYYDNGVSWSPAGGAEVSGDPGPPGDFLDVDGNPIDF